MPAPRPLALSLLLLCSAAAISQTAGLVNNPYTATKKVAFVQKLADGTIITRVSTTTEARDSQGRTVQQFAMTGAAQRNATSTTVIDPVAHTTTSWMSQSMQATRFHIPEPGIQRPTQPSGSAQPSGSMGSVTGMGSGAGVGAMGDFVTAAISSEPSVLIASGIGAGSTDANLRPTRQSEKLGGKTIAGVYAEGTKLTITYPIGFFGNDRPIANVRETWMSPELKIVVYTTDDDPRTGSRTTEITDLIRGEPDPALFQVPEGYTIKDQYPGQN
jgi:hypothetical protein